ncbi:thiol-disulfide oxidoreductase [Massilia violaceinigra]|uniref:Thiol-disulfide oxidoreductase n=1 Tax=Massilia violaceinigra TaxID=2045208 RepID=A0A2D2DS99_9BURK|nr:thiol-disulfide oxidoreductase [Massilia violaceinigra]
MSLAIRPADSRMRRCFDSDALVISKRDVHAEPELAAQLGIDIEQLRERLHVRDASGRMLSGDRAFAALWAATPGQRWLARLVRSMSWLTGPLYKLFARLLYRWNRRRGHW